MVEKAKKKVVYFCQQCGSDSPKWFGKCQACGEWGTCAEDVVPTSTKRTALPSRQDGPKAVPVPLPEVSVTEKSRLNSKCLGIDRLLGGGMVAGSVLLLGGEPGIGKSTLLLQLVLNLAPRKTLYVSGEESPEQIRLRAERLGELPESCYLLAETSAERIVQQAQKLQPELVVIDSIQTLYTPDLPVSPGNIAQIRACAFQLTEYAKTWGVPLFVIGHINKEGALAGPKVLEHMVDVVLQFEGDRHQLYRLLRVHKNRFGSTHELGIYHMTQNGMQVVENPYATWLSLETKGQSGMATGSVLEGNRALLVEVQALVSSAAYGTVQRVSTGFDAKRLNMLLALLEKKTGAQLRGQDVFLNVTGGLKVTDPAMDLAVCMAILSSLREETLPAQTLFCAEMGLAGELRSVPGIEKRLGEAEKMGFTNMVLSKQQKDRQKTHAQKTKKIKILNKHYLSEVISEVLP